MKIAQLGSNEFIKREIIKIIEKFAKTFGWEIGDLYTNALYIGIIDNVVCTTEVMPYEGITSLHDLLETLQKGPSNKVRGVIGEWIISPGRHAEQITGWKYKKWFVSTYINEESGYIQEEWDTNVCRAATKEEIKDSLLIEADRRYPLGTKFKTADPTNKKLIFTRTGPMYSNPNFDAINCNEVYGPCVYLNGIWAEVCIEDSLEIDGHKVLIDDDFVKIGCATFSISMCIDLWDTITYFGIESIQIEGHSVSRDKLEKIYRLITKRL